MELDGKVALVTGAGSGIGRASAITLAGAGAKLMLVDYSVAGLEETAAAIRDAGGSVEYAKVDVTDAAAVEDAVVKCVDRFGRLDIAHNNAGVSDDPIEFAEVQVSAAARIIDVNFWGVFHGMQAEIHQMLAQGDGGTIVNTASGAGLVATPCFATYCASKHAVVGLTKSVAVEYARRGIRINAVCPGYVETPMTESHRHNEAATSAIVGAHPIGRIARPQEIADAVLWLASERSSFVVGTPLVVDGGYSLV